ncbi:MAG: hypothetical protein M5U25_02500 [Planctomycetota bacterium]|nr:hypothetical protein [Planctomycetota bacterium]
MITGDSGDDYIWGDAGSDTLSGGDDNDKFDGGDGQDRIYGQNGDDTLIDRSGDYQDTLSGGDGNDILDCFDNPLAVPDPAARPDNVTGDGGIDTFWIDDVDVNDVQAPLETATVANSLLSLPPDDYPPASTQNKPPVR